MMSMSVDKQKFLESMGRSLGKSFGSINKSFTQPGFLEAYYNFQFSNAAHREIGSPTTNLAMLEDKFCKDFNCCGLQLNDMHELLQHFEEAHVIVEDEEMEEDDDLPFHFETTSGGGMDIDHNCNNPFGSIYGRKQIGANANNVGPQSVALSDIYQQEIVSAFETSVIRKRGAQQTEYSSQPWLRPVSDSPPKTFPIVHVPVQERSDDEYQEDVIERKAKEREIADDRDDRPYKCKIAGCNKAYKNPGGLKYHLHHGHCEDTGDPEMNNIMHKPYQCTVIDCGKRYKNLNGLKYHIEHAHVELLGQK